MSPSRDLEGTKRGRKRPRAAETGNGSSSFIILLDYTYKTQTQRELMRKFKTVATKD